jgi:hypothetical protein
MRSCGPRRDTADPGVSRRDDDVNALAERQRERVLPRSLIRRRLPSCGEADVLLSVGTDADEGDRHAGVLHDRLDVVASRPRKFLDRRRTRDVFAPTGHLAIDRRCLVQHGLVIRQTRQTLAVGVVGDTELHGRKIGQDVELGQARSPRPC